MVVSLKSYAFGIARSDDPERRNTHAELCSLASRALQARVVPYIAPSYNDLFNGVRAGSIAFAWMPPLLVLQLEDQKVGAPLALPVRYGSTVSFYSAIIAARSGLTSLHQLRGKRAAWVDRQSVAGYIVPRLHLAQQGLDAASLGRESFLRSHDAVVDEVVAGRADFGATFCTVDPRSHRIVHAAWTAPDGTDIKPVAVLGSQGPIPNDAVAVSEAVAPEVREKMLAWLLAPDSPRTQALMKTLMRAESFIRALPAHYAPLRTSLEQARQRGIVS